jgi:hypothetical protein
MYDRDFMVRAFDEAIARGILFFTHQDGRMLVIEPPPVFCSHGSQHNDDFQTFEKILAVDEAKYDWSGWPGSNTVDEIWSIDDFPRATGGSRLFVAMEFAPMLGRGVPAQ